MGREQLARNSQGTPVYCFITGRIKRRFISVAEESLMIHPFRTLLYELLIEPCRQAWQQLLAKFEGPATGQQGAHSGILLVGNRILVPLPVAPTNKPRRIV
jgi:hypothetical protein